MQQTAVAVSAGIPTFVVKIFFTGWQQECPSSSSRIEILNLIKLAQERTLDNTQKNGPLLVDVHLVYTNLLRCDQIPHSPAMEANT